MDNLKIPVGTSDFAEIRQNGYYYVDKTVLISELLKTASNKVTLITRPRRFGKSLGMSMLENFFDIRKDSRTLFAGLEISQNKALCDEWMNQYPTISVSFSRVFGLNYTKAYDMLTMVIADLFNKHLYLIQNGKGTDFENSTFKHLADGCASEKEIKSSFLLLTGMMQNYYKKPVILLIDEYDVPVEKANNNGYYAEMLDTMKSLMQALKDNQALKFAVVTGCLKIAKESIFTGTNNFVSETILSSRLSECFGFVQCEVNQILADAGIEGKAEMMKKWYDGYHFGSVDVYCPWDVMCYVQKLMTDSNAQPDNFWKNTSDNAVIRSFIDYAGASITKKFETLMDGGYIVQKVDENLTYDYLHSSEENLWSMLYLTGYLTHLRDGEIAEALPEDTVALKIPNLEIQELFVTEVSKWFKENASQWNKNALFEAVWRGDCERITGEVSTLLRRTISYHDYGEDFYHAFLSGIFAGAGYQVDSNKEHGEGRSDVVVCDTINGRVAIFEAKRAMTLDDLESACDKALRQIDQRMYAKDFEDEYDSDHIHCYGIAFYKKRCFVKKKD